MSGATQDSPHRLQSGATVCITGATGFLGGWLVKACLERGYSVRACVRDVGNQAKCGFLKAMPKYGGQLTLHSADMIIPGAYDTIFEGCSSVFHPAELFMAIALGKEDETPERIERFYKESVTTRQNIVDSINKSSTVTQLIYTSTCAVFMGRRSAYSENPVIDENAKHDLGHYAFYYSVKRSTAEFFADRSVESGGKWAMISGNPANILGPILSAHQANDAWQGRIGNIMQGIPIPQESNGNYWYTVDVRDVAIAEIQLAESNNVKSGTNFLIASGHRILPENLGVKILEIYADWDCATTVTPADGCESVVATDPVYELVCIRNDRVREATSLNFRTLEETLKATADELVSVGNVKPKQKEF